MRHFLSILGLLLVLGNGALIPGCSAAGRGFAASDEGDRIGDTAPGQDNRSMARPW